MNDEERQDYIERGLEFLKDPEFPDRLNEKQINFLAWNNKVEPEPVKLKNVLFILLGFVVVVVYYFLTN